MFTVTAGAATRTCYTAFGDVGEVMFGERWACGKTLVSTVGFGMAGTSGTSRRRYRGGVFETDVFE
jgi:hypothetical protein